MRAGNMRNVVEVYKPRVTTDAVGQETYTYDLYKIVFAGYERDSFRKDESGFIQASGQETITFKLRYDPTIGYNHRLVFNDTTYRITSVDNFKNLRHELRIQCVAVDL